MNIAAWDLGASAAKKYDIEAWMPGQGDYREVTSCSNTTDYQARRLNARYRPEEGASPRHLHTLNGTAVAVSRAIIAIVENGQRDDGTSRSRRCCTSTARRPSSQASAAARSMQRVLKEFRQFILRGNLVDLAVAVVIGTAFGAVVTALVADLITPLIAASAASRTSTP